MRSAGLQWSIFSAVLACLATTAVFALIGLSPLEHQPASPSTVWLADDDQDQLNLMEQQQAQQTAQQAEDLAQQEQQIVDQQNAFDESMTAGNS
jgi:galactose mutarotase-like enzyme